MWKLHSGTLIEPLCLGRHFIVGIRWEWKSGPVALNVTEGGEDAYLTPAGAKARPLHVHPKCSPRTTAHGVN